jgi:hypothetical protein
MLDIEKTIMNQERADKIDLLIEELLKEDKSYTEDIILQAIICGSNNGYEGLGILEKCKFEWVRMMNEIAEESE